MLFWPYFYHVVLFHLKNQVPASPCIYFSSFLFFCSDWKLNLTCKAAEQTHVWSVGEQTSLHDHSARNCCTESRTHPFSRGFSLLKANMQVTTTLSLTGPCVFEHNRRFFLLFSCIFCRYNTECDCKQYFKVDSNNII